jgi:hypothetical protein
LQSLYLGQKFYVALNNLNSLLLDNGFPIMFIKAQDESRLNEALGLLLSLKKGNAVVELLLESLQNDRRVYEKKK